MGRPLAKIDAQQLEALAGIGCTVAEIAVVLKCSKDTLERRFAAHIEKGRQTAKVSLRRMQWKSAQNGSAALQIWLGKQILGQTDKQEIKGDVKHHHEFDPTKLTDEQLAQARVLIESAHVGINS